MAANFLWDDEAFDQPTEGPGVAARGTATATATAPASDPKSGQQIKGADVVVPPIWAVPDVPDDLADDDNDEDDEDDDEEDDDNDNDDDEDNESHEHDIEAEYAQLGAPSDGPSRGASSNLVSTSSAGPPVTFAMDDDEHADEHVDDSHHLQDFRPPEAPDAPPDFSPEDLRLREVLIRLYLRYKPDNVANVNTIVEKYRGRGVVDLFAQLGSKYAIPPSEVVTDFLSGALFADSAFELPDSSMPAQVEQAIASYRSTVGDRATPSSSSTSSCSPFSGKEQALLLPEILKDLERPAKAELALVCLRYISFRGLGPGAARIRPKVWKLLTGTIKASSVGQWDAAEGEMRELYASYKSGILLVSNDAKPRFSVKVEQSQLMEAMKLLQQIQRDVERTRQDRSVFRRASTRAIMISILFVYANINPDISYVQGMNEMLATVIHALSVQDHHSESDEAQAASDDVIIEEADVFWCFSFLLSELKGDLRSSFEGAPAEPSLLASVLRIYDPKLANHFAQLGCPIQSFVIRWCCLLFSQDLPLDQVVQLWDTLLASPQRGRLATHFAVAAMLSVRDELLALQDAGLVHELLAALPKSLDARAWWRRGTALCALETRNLERSPAYPNRPGGLANANSMLAATASWAKRAATRAQELSTGAASNVQQKVVPALREHVGKAKDSQVAQEVATVTRGGLQAVKAWFEQDAPLQPEQVAKVADLWRRVSSKGKESSSTIFAATSAAAASLTSASSAPSAAASSRAMPSLVPTPLPPLAPAPASDPALASSPSQASPSPSPPAAAAPENSRGVGMQEPTSPSPSPSPKPELLAPMETSMEERGPVAVVAGEAEEEEDDGVMY